MTCSRWAEAAAAGDAVRALHVLLGLKSEGVEPTLILWALVRELRGLWQARERGRLRSAGRGSAWNLAATPSPARAIPAQGAAARGTPHAGKPHRSGHQRARGGRSLERAARTHRRPGRRFASCHGFRQGSTMNPMGIFGEPSIPFTTRIYAPRSNCKQALRLKEIRFLPAGNPPHRDQPLADAQLRLQWCSWRLPVRPVSSSMTARYAKRGRRTRFETLAELRHEYPDRSPLFDRGGWMPS